MRDFRNFTQNMTLGLTIPLYLSYKQTRMNPTIPIKWQVKVHLVYLDICIKRPRKGSKRSTSEKKINITPRLNTISNVWYITFIFSQLEKMLV